ncbi:histone chaperone napB [Aspergillus lucknowensis]|uniref:Nucleosome assembly protein n=1 Tax=Aspergillus lucknowensis TaxID=176173 RepID=A0ABR4LDF8_9EURO
MSNEHQGALAERVSEPVIPQEVAKDISLLEQQFIRAEVEQLRQSVLSFRPLFEKRAKIIAHPEVASNFWLRVLSNAPADIDEYISSSDAAILGSALKSLNVERFELDEKGQGEPRSIRFTFEFATGDANPFFENEKLVKEFYWRKQVLTTPSGKKRTWDGLVSEPVRINWKKDMDITKGLLDAACDLFEAEKKGGDRKELPEAKNLVGKLAEVEALEEEEEDEDDEYPSQTPGSSFFNFFGYRGSDVTAEHSATATKEENERFEKILKGENVEDDEADDDEEVDDDFDTFEVFPDGGELAIALAEDLWPNALKYYVQSFEEVPDFDEDDLEEGDESDDENDEDEASRPRKKTKV